jgi:hypothetical protein
MEDAYMEEFLGLGPPKKEEKKENVIWIVLRSGLVPQYQIDGMQAINFESLGWDRHSDMQYWYTLCKERACATAFLWGATFKVKDNEEEKKEVEENNKEEEEVKECENCAHLHSPEECKRCGVIKNGEDKGEYKNWKKIATNMVRCPGCLKDFTKVYVINWNEHGKNGPFVCPYCTEHVFNIGELKLEKEDNNETAN